MGGRHKFQLGSGVRFLAVGDSKTLGESCCFATNAYQNELESDLWPLVTNGAERLNHFAVGGLGVGMMRARVDAFLATAIYPPEWVLFNLGANDCPGVRSGAITEASWVADAGYILDAIHAKWPNAQVRIMRIYYANYASESNTIDDTFIPAVIVGRESWVDLGPDERTFLPGFMSDPAHPNATGYSKTADEWRAVMGY